MGIREVLKVLDLGAATELELQTQYRLMPIRYDRATLLPRAKEVTDWIRPQLEQGGFGSVASVVFADKASRGMRPLAEMDLTDKVLYRALVRHISDSLPPHLVERSRYEDFQTSVAPVDTTIGYVSKTDVAAYYEYVDHALLRDELLAQTGTGPAVLLLMDVLRAVMGRSVGLPQVHSSSDILGDCYIDPIRRRLVRSGFKTSSYSDDFRIYSTTLAEAKLALEACAFEARSLGLVLNEGKTLTYTAEHYFKSLDSFDDAQEKLLGADSPLLDRIATDRYADPDTRKEELAGLLEQVRQVRREVEDETATPELRDTPKGSDESSEAAERVWELWADEDGRGSTPRSPEDAALLRRLLGEALPVLGTAGDGRPLNTLSRLMRSEPSLTPATAEYLKQLSGKGQVERKAIRKSLDDLIAQESLSTWQQMWIADVTGSIIPSRGRQRPLYEWLAAQVRVAPEPLAAACAAAAGRIQVGDVKSLSAALDAVGPAWRGLVFWGLAQFDPEAAEGVAEDQLERMIIECVQ